MITEQAGPWEIPVHTILSHLHCHIAGALKDNGVGHHQSKVIQTHRTVAQSILILVYRIKVRGHDDPPDVLQIKTNLMLVSLAILNSFYFHYLNSAQFRCLLDEHILGALPHIIHSLVRASGINLRDFSGL